MKVSIIGGGGVVGSSAAYRIAQDGFTSEIILVDIRRNLAEAHALDIDQAIVHRSNTNVRAGDIKDTKDSDIIIISVGAIGRPMHSSRISHFGENIEIIKNLVNPIIENSPDTLWIIATVPVDAFVYLIHKNLSIPRERVIGLNRNDTSRFRWAIAKVLSVPPTSVEAFVLGEHGESMVPIFSQVRVNEEKVSFNQEQREKINSEIFGFLQNWIKWQPERTAGWTTAESIGDIIKSMVTRDNKILPCSITLYGEYGLRDVSLGVPIRIGHNWVMEIIEFELDELEKDALNKSAEVIRSQIKQGEKLFKV